MDLAFCYQDHTDIPTYAADKMPGHPGRAAFPLQGNVEKDSVWIAAQQLQAAVSSLAITSTDVGLRMAGIKMSEQAAILYTAPEALALPDADTLATTADTLLKQLGELLKEPSVQLPGPVVICCIKALGAMVMQRANMVHRGMPALLALATKVKDLYIVYYFALTIVAVSPSLRAQSKDMQRGLFATELRTESNMLWTDLDWPFGESSVCSIQGNQVADDCAGYCPRSKQPYWHETVKAPVTLVSPGNTGKTLYRLLIAPCLLCS